MTDNPQVEFSPTDDEADTKVRNDELLDALLEYTLLDIRTPEIMERLAQHFLDGIFFIPTESPVQPVEHLLASNVADHFKFMLLQDNGENYLPLYTDIESIKALLGDSVKDHVILEGISAARFSVTQNYAGTVLFSTRLENELMLPLESLKSMLGIKP